LQSQSQIGDDHNGIELRPRQWRKQKLDLDYYEALATTRGAVSGKGRAVAFDIDSFGKRRVLDSFP